MTESTPPPIELLRTEVQENAATSADTMRWYFRLAVGVSALMPLGILATWLMAPPNMVLPVALVQVVWMAIALTVLGLFWQRARKDLPNYANQTRITWKLECRDIEHSWDIEGLGPCEGWRRVAVRCVRLPKRQGKMLEVPMLNVMVDNGEKTLARGRLSEKGNTQHVALVDKAGKPIRIMISHDRREDASDELPWAVEVLVQGDPNPPQTLTATALVSGVREAEHG